MMPYFFDWTFVLVLPAMAFAMWAQSKVKRTYQKYSEVGTRSHYTGADVAKAILRDENIELTGNPLGYPGGPACDLESTPGQLTDHYDPRTRTLRLSEDIYHGQSVAALGIAAHEVGHAIQHARLYSPLMLRNIVYPACNIGSKAAFPLFFLGFILSSPAFMQGAIILFTLAVAFTLITLPVEFNASSRALRALSEGGYLEADELQGARKVLNAAALTYVAAAAVALSHLLRMVLLANRR